MPYLKSYLIAKRTDWRVSLPYVFLALALLLVYWPVLTNCFGFRDDYVYMFAYTHERSYLVHALSAMGRPLYDLASDLAFSRWHRTCDLGILRQFCWVTLVLFAWQVYRFCREHQCQSSTAFAIALGVCTVPGVSLFVFWAITFPFVFSLILSFEASSLLVSQNKSLSASRAVAAICLLITALSIYQVGAMAYWLAIGIAFFTSKTPFTFKRIFILLSLFGVGLVIYYAAYKFMLRWISHPEVLIFAKRGAITQNPLEKLNQVISLIARAGSLGFIRPVPMVAIPVAILIFYLAWQARSFKQKLFQLTVIGSLVLFTLLPMLPVQEVEINLRLISITAALIWALFILALNSVLPSHALRSSLLVILTMLQALAISSNMNISIALFQAEHAAIVEDIQRHTLDNPDNKVYLAPTTESNWQLGAPRGVEYGTPSTQFAYGNLRTQYQQIYFELTGRPSKHIYQACPPQDGVGCDLSDMQDPRIRPVPSLIRQHLPSQWPLHPSVK